VAEAKDEVREQYAREYPPAPSEKPQPSVPEGLYDTESGLPANAEKPQQGTPRTDAVCDTPIMGTACTPHKWDKLQEHARQLERELAQTRLERDSARNVLARAIERERLANMRADQAEEAREAAQEVANRETLSAAYWKDRADAFEALHVAALSATPAMEALHDLAVCCYQYDSAKPASVANYRDALQKAYDLSVPDLAKCPHGYRRKNCGLCATDKTASDKGQG
jgi:hypothetical protein